MSGTASTNFTPESLMAASIFAPVNTTSVFASIPNLPDAALRQFIAASAAS
jgi:hypothetical protein